MSVNKIVAAAGTSKGSYFHHFTDRRDYLIALHRQFHDDLISGVLATVDGQPHGAARLRAAAHAYLDAFLGARGVRALLIDARAEPLILAEVARRNTIAAQNIEPDLAALGWADPAAAARLMIATIAEAAIVEFEHGRVHEATRAVLDALISRPIGDAAPEGERL